jgi:hypothetical protein
MVISQMEAVCAVVAGVGFNAEKSAVPTVNKTKTPQKEGLNLQLGYVSKERGLTKFYGTNIIHIFVFPKKN